MIVKHRLYTFLGLFFPLLFILNWFPKREVADPAPPKTIEERIDSVMKLMNLEEKIGQMTLFTSDWDVTGPTLRANYKDDIKSGRVGAIFNAHTAAYNRELQRIAVEETRLGIPLIFGYDVIHGYKTIFPISLGEAASWDLEAVEKAARVAAVEASAAGLHWTFAPMVDISRDPRWGRVSESAGEDPYLGSVMARARVRGFQGDDLKATNTLVACAKHFAAYGAAQAGRDYHTVDMSERVLREVYLPPFKAALEEGVGTFMTSFNEIFGVPASGSDFLLDQILKTEWGFDGFVVTDYTSINEMVDHGVVATEKEAGELAVNAGVDMDMQGAVFYDHLAQLVKEKKVSEKQLDEAVRRILRVKFQLGLFDDPYRYSDVSRQKAALLAPEHLEAARDVARKSVVLLKNDRQTLPLSKDLKSIAVIGPLATSQADLLGSWHAAGFAEDCVSLLDGIKEVAGPNTSIMYAKGCEIVGGDQSGFPSALTIASQADVIIAAVGERWDMSGEAASRSNIELPGHQKALIKALKELGKPVVVVLMNGRPLALPEVHEQADAILETWYAGTMGGPAIADVLFGDYNPSGKLPVTFPRNVGQVPIHYDMKNTGRPMDPNDKYTSKYIDVANTPLYPFGYGLSYTQFEYAEAKVNKTSFRSNETLQVEVNVKNTGQYEGKETVQLYVRDLVGSVTRPVKELKGFQQIVLAPGQSQTVRFGLTAENLKFYDRNMQWTYEPGEFDIFVGPHSAVTKAVRVELIKK